MLTRIQARNYRCLKQVDQSLTGFEVFVGGNGVGKSTFLDVVCLLGEIVRQPRNGLISAISVRSANFEDLLFDSSIGFFELAVEAKIPESIANATKKFGPDSVVRYQIRIGFTDIERTKIGILEEHVLLVKAASILTKQPTFEESILLAIKFSATYQSDQSFAVVSRSKDVALFQDEDLIAPGTEKQYTFNLGANNSALANLPEDPLGFPVATWFRRFLSEGCLHLRLAPEKLRQPVSAISSNGEHGDELNLPLVVNDLLNSSNDQFEDWINHLRIALPDLKTIRVTERPEDRRRYLVVEYTDGRKVPSWLLSDGTLRLIGLTLPAYALDNGTIFLIEEPENCIHPLAIEIVMQSLSSMYESQVLVTTHSPAILSLTAPNKILCFSKTPEDGTLIVRGDKHPRLSAWKGSVDPGMLLASGILG